MLTGVFTALITPMKENGDVDYDGFRELVRFQIANGVNGIVPLGTTGESPTLEEDEEEKLIEIAVKECSGKIPVIVGAGSNSTKSAMSYTRRAKDLGANAVLVVTPYYNKPNDAGILLHFEAVAKIGIPVIVYNIASRTGRNINTALMGRLSEIPGIAGVKESSGDVNQMADIIHNISKKRASEGHDFSVVSGDDALTLPLLALGGHGVISVASNLVPGKVVDLVKAGLAGDFARARVLHYELLPFVNAVFVETNPIPIK
ncbi:MAG: 4-hydroxy-tetrahydrodipicolinate synthase, partial [Treponema sp.]|nr:4-hydroxy-tetrahydrodipicolinate synthase [Treponema sp.]